MCVAVDNAGLAVVFDGTSWGAPMRVPHARPLKAVSCPDMDGCIAIDDSAAYLYDGAGWSAGGTPRGADSLVDLSCVDADDCVVVDARGDAFSRSVPGPA
jgi:hypothetical protein